MDMINIHLFHNTKQKQKKNPCTVCKVKTIVNHCNQFIKVTIDPLPHTIRMNEKKKNNDNNINEAKNTYFLLEFCTKTCKHYLKYVFHLKNFRK